MDAHEKPAFKSHLSDANSLLSYHLMQTPFYHISSYHEFAVHLHPGCNKTSFLQLVEASDDKRAKF